MLNHLPEKMRFFLRSILVISLFWILLSFVPKDSFAASSAWSTITVPDGGTGIGRHSSLAIDGSTYLVSYAKYFVPNYNLGFAKSEDGGESWNIDTVDSTISVGLFTSLAVVSPDYYVISYWDYTNANLKFAKTEDGGDNWDVSTVDNSPGNVGRFSNIAVDGTKLIISYYDLSNTSLKVAISIDGGDSWDIDTIDNTSSVGDGNAITVAGPGTYLISHYDHAVGNAKIRVAKTTDGGDSWSLATALSLGTSADGNTAVTTDPDGNYLIAYGADAGADNGLYFAKSPNGLTGWDPTFIFSDGNWPGFYTSIRAVSSTKYLVYSGNGNYYTNYFSESNDGGETWDTIYLNDYLSGGVDTWESYAGAFQIDQEGNYIISWADESGNSDLRLFFRDNVMPQTSLSSPPSSTSDTTPAFMGTASDSKSNISLVEYQIDSTSGPWSTCSFDTPVFTESFEGGTFPPSGWNFGGDADWVQDAVIYQDGSKSAASGAITHSQSSTIDTSITVDRETTISFYSKVSSEEGCDYLFFCLDNLSCTADSGYTSRMSGEIDWILNEYTLSAGTHTLKWGYEKDGSVDEGDDTGWVDTIVTGHISEPFTCQVSSELPEGTHTLYIRSTDAGGNTTLSGSETSHTFSVDTTPPAPYAYSPPSGSAINDSTPTITFSLNENGDCRASRSDESYDNMSDDTDCTGDGTTSMTCTLPDLGEDGNKLIYIACKDTLGNKDTVATNEFVVYTLDTVPPPISITYIDYYQVLFPVRWLTNRQPLFEGSTEANTAVRVRVSGTVISDWMTSNGNGYWYWQSDTALPLGTYAVTATAWDAAGNSSSDEVTLVMLSDFGNDDDGDDDGDEDEDGDDEDQDEDGGDDEDTDDQDYTPPPPDQGDDDTGPGEEEPASVGTILGNLFDSLFGSETGLFHSVTDFIKELNRSTTGRSSSVALLSLAGVTGTVNVAAMTGTSLLQIPLLFSNSFIGGILGFTRKRKPWGIVYDSVTKEPLSRAIVRVYRNDELAQTTVTDINGVFTVDLGPGTYTLMVQRGSYVFPSTLVIGDKDGQRTPIYTGGPVESPPGGISIYAPVDPESVKAGGKILIQARSLGSTLLDWGAFALVAFGIVFSFWSFLVSGGFVYLLLALLNILILMFNLYNRGQVPGTWGQVLTRDGQPVSGMEIGLYDFDYGRLIDNRVTDDQGRYRFIAPGKRYWLKPVGTEYTLAQLAGKGGVQVGWEQDQELLIAERVIVRKVTS